MNVEKAARNHVWCTVSENVLIAIFFTSSSSNTMENANLIFRVSKSCSLRHVHEEISLEIFSHLHNIYNSNGRLLSLRLLIICTLRLIITTHSIVDDVVYLISISSLQRCFRTKTACLWVKHECYANNTFSSHKCGALGRNALIK